MKKVIITIVVSFIAFNGWTQLDRTRYDWIHMTSMMNNNQNINFILNLPKNAVLQMMGNYDAVKPLDGDAVTGNINEYKYGTNSIFIDEDDADLWGFKLKNASFGLYYNTFFLKVGDNLNKIQEQFPLSYSSKESGWIFVTLTTEDWQDTDTILYFKYNEVTKLITEIGVVDNSD